MIEDIEKIIKIFECANVSKLSLELENMKLSLEKNEENKMFIENKDTNNIVSKEECCNLEYIESPVVGTFYTSRAPEKPPFITVGSKVKKGDVLCIIEAMKVMNEVVSPCSGVVKEIYFKNESLVEYGKRLIAIGDIDD